MQTKQKLPELELFPNMKKSKIKLFEIYGENIPNDNIPACDNFRPKIYALSTSIIMHSVAEIYYHYINETIKNDENACGYINNLIEEFNEFIEKIKIKKIDSIIGNNHAEKSIHFRKILNDVYAIMKINEN
jgi:hypothetical protein